MQVARTKGKGAAWRGSLEERLAGRKVGEDLMMV
jgi:hypothetical protein